MLKLGITGYPLKYTLSPTIHKKLLKKVRRDGSYDVLPFDPALGKRAFFSFLDFLRRQGYVGLNVTVPHKEWAFDYASARSGTIKAFEGRCAQSVGAANTLVFTSAGKVLAANTDAGAVCDDIKDWLVRRECRTKSVDLVIVGTGGAARGVLAGIIADHEVCRYLHVVRIWGRNKRKSKLLENLVPRAYASSKKTLEQRTCLVVWCLAPLKKNEVHSIFYDHLHELVAPFGAHVLFYDLNYGKNSESTRELLPSRRWRSGAKMLKLQAEASFQIWLKAAKSLSL